MKLYANEGKCKQAKENVNNVRKCKTMSEPVRKCQ